MRTLERGLVCVLGLIGAVDALIVNILVVVYRQVARLVGISTMGSHGLWGVVFVVAAAAGACAVFAWPRVGGVLLLVAGIGFIFVAHWWALLATPQLLIAGTLAVMADQAAAPARGQPGGVRPPVPAT